ncbi:DUF427 domain-containing protein [Lyngbya confervoides]|uniref:DUF427 domain-containing protein n=1 Tax=Lyngbya confervoides BDU141951 TaxID=1574623 RepID=A0ABD4T8U2_9CYAN|nr:DUF427 domain-containing protein [Lyngbya confervoides]MCM1984740.1 DUF427 domain-containing protein [Lyngbya confervoides BDU141951]
MNSSSELSGEGKESVWDYPRPPRLEASVKEIKIELAGMTLAASRRTYRVLETSHPPVFYIPPEDVCASALYPTPRRTFCEWKGVAHYYTLKVGDQVRENAAWYYPQPTPAFIKIKNYLAFYPSLMDACWVDGEPVQAQPGDFYGGWITADIVGPFKGGSGSLGW